MKKVLIVLAMSTLSYPLQAPYLISAAALSDSSVQLQWRNNDAATTGFIIQRADSGGSNFKLIDSVKTATTLSYIDIKLLQPQATYTYRLLAYNETTLSDVSNTLQVTTLAFEEIFKKPSLLLSWDIDTSKSIRVTIFDSSNCETGYRIYRNQDFSATFQLVAQVISDAPKKKDTIPWFDSTISVNQWYNYTVAAFKNSDSIFSTSCSTYTYRAPQAKQTTKFHKVSEFPLSLDQTNWSAKSGDSIIIKESNAPQGKYSIINVADPANPVFDGYIDSVQLLKYPNESLIPIFFRYGVSNVMSQMALSHPSVYRWADKVFLLKDSLVYLFKIENGDLLKIDSIQRISMQGYLIPAFNENMIIIENIVNNDRNAERHFIQIISFSDSGFKQFPVFIFEPDVNDIFNGVRFTIDGILDKKLYAYCYRYRDLGGNNENSEFKIIHDIDQLQRDIICPTRTNAPGDSISTIVQTNSGIYISPSEYICTIRHWLYTEGFTSKTYYYNYKLFAANLLNEKPLAIDRNDSIFFESGSVIYHSSQGYLSNTGNIVNVFLDSLDKNLFVISPQFLTVLNYQSAMVNVRYQGQTPSAAKGPDVRTAPFSAGVVSVILPPGKRSSDLYFYDLSGRQIDRMRNVTSKAVLWRPKTRSMGCYFVIVKSGGERYVERFFVR
jgi:hypothetical protein